MALSMSLSQSQSVFVFLQQLMLGSHNSAKACVCAFMCARACVVTSACQAFMVLFFALKLNEYFMVS